MKWNNYTKVSLEKAKHIISDTDSAHCFWTHSGKRVRNLHELEHVLSHMPMSEFLHHVHDTKNDFSVWVLDVIGDEYLAAHINKQEHPLEISKTIRKRIVSLENHINKDTEKVHKVEENIFSHSEEWKDFALIALCIVLFFLGIYLAMGLIGTSS